jgi:hypothetical protein
VLLSFSWLNNIPLCRFNTFCSSICQLIVICVVFTFWLSWIFVCPFCMKVNFKILCSIIRGINIGSYSKSMIHFLIDCQTFSQCFISTRFYYSSFSTTSPTVALFHFWGLVLVTLVSVEWYLHVVLIWIPLMTNDDEHVFMCLDVYPNLLLIFKIDFTV